ncbi:MAG: glycosyltransferase family 4 protein [Capsulimonadaceae bacterium]|nr:glycosyltransferase family 4 protein [Capsulimonadaceae bacterium]
MRIVHLVAGAGQMYCGACARDAALLSELSRRGHDVRVVQLYTPMRLDRDGVADDTAVYLGGVSLYLEQTVPGYNLVSGLFRGFLDSPAVLRWAGQFAVRTQPETLGPMTVAMLSGSAGRQREPIARLQAFLNSLPQPDVVIIANSLLSGLAPHVGGKAGIPIVCGLMGEDSFIDRLPSPYREQAIDLLRANASAIDRFVAPSRDHARTMAALLDVPIEKIVPVPAGIRADGFRPAPSRQRGEPYVIGYLSSIDQRKGLDLLVDALRILVRDVHRNVKIIVAGKPLNEAYWKEIRAKVDAAWLDDRFEYVGELDFAGKVAFLERCSVFCVPSRIAESRGIAAMEAMAAGLTVVAPGNGVYPELLREGTAGILFEPEGVEELASALAWAMDNPELTAQIGANAGVIVRSKHSVETMADAAVDAYEEAIRASRAG